MTTNQTIDGVPRELLEKLVEPGMESGITDAEWDELRALLDAPAKLDLIECDACPTSGGCVSVCMKAPKPAAQPQGEPVAYQRKSKIAGSEWHYINGCDVAEAVSMGFEVRPLYAEQPAQVAVVLPDRKDGNGPSLSNHRSYNQGWNACLDEVTRLNAKD